MEYGGRDMARGGLHRIIDDAGRVSLLGGSCTDSPEEARERAAELRTEVADRLERAERLEFLADALERERTEATERAAAQRRERAAATRRRNLENRPAWAR